MFEFEVLYWHWLVLGMCLMAGEILLPSFISLWFGLAALVVGLLMLIFPTMDVTLQVLLWVLGSISFTALWFILVRPLAKDKTQAGFSSEKIINETGMVIRQPIDGEKGELRFSTPKLGNEEWLFLTEDTVAIGDRVRVVAISGNSLVVVKA
jgi:hypothetical protein